MQRAWVPPPLLMRVHAVFAAKVAEKSAMRGSLSSSRAVRDFLAEQRWNAGEIARFESQERTTM